MDPIEKNKKEEREEKEREGKEKKKGREERREFGYSFNEHLNTLLRVNAQLLECWSWHRSDTRTEEHGGQFAQKVTEMMLDSS